MDTGQVDWPEPDIDLNVLRYKGKGKGTGSWSQPSWDQQPQHKGGKDGGKGKGKKGGKDGGKSKGKGKEVQCWTCSGWGHRSNQCPNDAGKGGKGGVNEVGDGPSTQK